MATKKSAAKKTTSKKAATKKTTKKAVKKAPKKSPPLMLDSRLEASKIGGIVTPQDWHRFRKADWHLVRRVITVRTAKGKAALGIDKKGNVGLFLVDDDE